MFYVSITIIILNGYKLVLLCEFTQPKEGGRETHPHTLLVKLSPSTVVRI